MSNFSAISWQEQAIFNYIRFGVWVGEHAYLDFYSATCSSLKQQSVGRYVTPFLTH
jgi:hypothetical protein